MKITGLKTVVVTVPFVEPEYWAWGKRTGLTNVIIRMQTDDGVEGLGEAPSFPATTFTLDVIAGAVELLLGEDPFNVERIMKRLYGFGGWHHYRAAANSALAGIEMALWDIIGKTCKQPIHRLMGGLVRNQIPYMYFLIRRAPEAMGEDAARAVELGYHTLYLKVGIDPDADFAQVKAVREAVGSGPKLRVDANEAWSSATAIREINRMKPFDLEYVEQPTPAHNLKELAHVRQVTGVPICANESSWTHQDVFNVIMEQAADVIEIDPHMDGGLLAFKKEAAMCEAAGLPVVKHSYGELGIATAAAAHVMATCPNFIFANQGYTSFLKDDIIQEPLEFEGDSLKVPTGPGIGVTIDEEKLTYYARRFEADGAHSPYGVIDSTAVPFTPRF